MTTKFRRNTDRALLNHLNDYNDVRKDVDIVQDNTTNTGIIGLINPLSDDLDMNGKDILNTDNIDTKTINTTTLTTSNISPISGLINVQGDILFNRQGSIYDTNAMRTNAFIVNNIIKNTVNPGLNTEIKILSNLDLNTNNNITGVNNIETKTINGGSILTNPLTSDLNMAGFSIYNAGGISTNILNSNADGTPIYVNTNIDMTGVDIVDVGRVETGSIRILDQVDLNNTGSINGCTEIFCNDAYAKRILKNQVANAEDIQMEKIRMLENINMDNNSIENINVLTTNSITSDQALITVNKSIDMKQQSILGISSIYTEIVEVSNKIELSLTGSIVNGVSIQTNELETDTLKSVNPSTADISVMNNLNMQQKNISDVQQLTVKQVRKSTAGMIFNDIMVYDGINMNNQKIINCNDLQMTGPIFTAGNNINLNGGQLNNVDSINIVGDGKITGANLIESVNITSTGTIASTIINNSGILRSGGIIQDTAITAYGQIKQDGAPLIVAVPLSPNPSLQLTFNNLLLSPHNTQTNATTITILHAGTYRVVVSLVGIMDGDRQMDLFLRKNGINISFVFLSRLGNRSIEASINELINMNIGDVISIAIQARDTAFNFAYHSGLLQVERIRKNTL